MILSLSCTLTDSLPLSLFPSVRPQPACKRLWCAERCSGRNCSEGCRTQHMPWADGTACGGDSWCQRGECVPRSPQPDTVHGGWGDWAE